MQAPSCSTGEGNVAESQSLSQMWHEMHTAQVRAGQLTNRGRSGASNESEMALLQAGGAAQLTHGGVQTRLDVGPGAHVLGLLLAPHQLRIPILRHHLRSQTAAMLFA